MGGMTMMRRAFSCTWFGKRRIDSTR